MAKHWDSFLSYCNISVQSTLLQSLTFSSKYTVMIKYLPLILAAHLTQQSRIAPY